MGGEEDVSEIDQCTGLVGGIGVSRPVRTVERRYANDVGDDRALNRAVHEIDAGRGVGDEDVIDRGRWLDDEGADELPLVRVTVRGRGETEEVLDRDGPVAGARADFLGDLDAELVNRVLVACVGAGALGFAGTGVEGRFQSGIGWVG